MVPREVGSGLEMVRAQDATLAVNRTEGRPRLCHRRGHTAVPRHGEVWKAAASSALDVSGAMPFDPAALGCAAPGDAGWRRQS